MKLEFSPQPIRQIIEISGSKSESNRWLILQKLFDGIEITNLSDSEDSRVLQEALATDTSSYATIDIGHAGTAMRFATAYFAQKEGADVLLTGSKRMLQRPIAPLVEALKSMGADISYVQEEGYPPLRIKGKKITQNVVKIRADISSQFITALLLIGAKMDNGLRINFSTQLNSQPYVEMTLKQLRVLGLVSEMDNTGIRLYPFQESSSQQVTVTPDWSSSSYMYSIVALAENAEIELLNYRFNGLQGDEGVAKIYEQFFGVSTIITEKGIKLVKTPNFKLPESFELNLNNMPDLAQTIAVSAAGLGIKAKLSGLQSLKVKETDRLQALQNELKKIGTSCEIDGNSLEIKQIEAIPSGVSISTYDDHRMAMSFAPIALVKPLHICDPQVVKKSYRTFWDDLAKLGFSCEF